MRGYVLLSFIAVFTISNFAIFPSPQAFDAPPPSRHATVTETYTEHEWWLLAWADNQLACQVLVEQDGLPALSEIKADCTAEVYKLWLEQPLCSAAVNGSDLSACSGYYLYYIGSHQAEREVVVELPPAFASVALEGCSQDGYETVCPLLPSLEVTGVEPLSDYAITQVHYEYRGRWEACEGAVCQVPLSLTTLKGEPISFWADSSFGDSSQHYELYFRIKPNGDGRWQVDILSDQVPDGRNQAASLEWKAFPPLGQNPQWLSYQADASALATRQPYQYLAGQLIRVGAADASACADGGLLGSGYASQCGLEQAMDEVIAWQNQFDGSLFETANRFDLSPQLLKNVIAQESQFWPGMYVYSANEYGLARLTETGSDTLLRWNDNFYSSFCAPLLSEEACSGGYNRLAPAYQGMLRGALATRVNTYCEACQYGFDLERAAYGIEVLAQSLLADAAQVEQMFENLTERAAGLSSTYEDLWRFALVDYNAGAGCLAAALSATVKGNAELNWRNVSDHLIGDCHNAINYVENITK